MSAVSFTIEKRLPGRLGRAARIETPHGSILTPAFIPVGTKASVKGITPGMLVSLGAQAVLGNTYHLYLEPGERLIEEAGGLGAFMGWQGPTFTDSGGFQVFSLGAGFGKGVSKFAKPEAAIEEESILPYNRELAEGHGKLAILDDDGVTFTSHIDGSMHRFTPERSIEIQHALGADIMFAFDECTAPSAPYAYQKEALERTNAWAKRSILAHKRNYDALKRQALFGIVQGGRHEDLRRESAEALSRMDFDGYGIGGSFSKEDLDKTLSLTCGIIPEEKPRHLLGIGSEPVDLLTGIEQGIDTFDCVAPTRTARTGQIYTKEGTINLLNTRFRNDLSKPDECTCPTCSAFSKAYLAHLFRSREMLGPVLASIHNLFFCISLVEKARESILSGTFDAFKEAVLSRYRS